MKTLIKGIASAMVGAMMLTVVPAVSAVDTPAPATTTATTAATTTTSPATSTPQLEIQKTCHQLINEQLSHTMEQFLGFLKMQAYENAYHSTTAGFQRNVKLAEFNDLVAGTGLGNYTSLNWISLDTLSFKQQMLTAKLVTPENMTRILQFDLKLEGKIWQIDTISELPLVDFFAKLFPADEKLKSRIQSDLQSFIDTIKSENYNAFYNSLAKSAKKTLKRFNVTKSLQAFKKQGYDITLPASGIITLSPCAPVITSSGTAVINGTYKNDKNTVDFRFEYTYEWLWKLSGFNINTSAIAKSDKK